jgi:hypothetical protein
VSSQTCEIGVVRQLVDRCATGEAQAWRDLHRTYYPTARRFLARMGVPGDDLEDACQDVFVQVFRYLARFEQRAGFQTWLYKLCLSQASRLRRRRKLQQALGWLLGRERAARGTSAGAAGTSCSRRWGGCSGARAGSAGPAPVTTGARRWPRSGCGGRWTR